MKELRVVIRIRNNRLQQRREELGLTIEQLARKAGLHPSSYQKYESASAKPITRQGEWKGTAIRLAEFHGLEPAELFPESVIALTRNIAHLNLDAPELASLAGITAATPMLPTADMERLADNRAVAESMKRKLSPRETVVLARRVGLIDDTEQTLEEIGDYFGICRERVRDIEQQAYKKLREDRKLQRDIGRIL